MAKKTTYTGLYLPEGNGEPEVIFRDADKATRYNGLEYQRRAVPIEIADIGDVSAPKDFAGVLQVASPPPTSSPLDAIEGEVRTSLREKLLREQLEKDLHDEVQKSVQADLKALRPDKPVATTTTTTPPTQ